VVTLLVCLKILCKFGGEFCQDIVLGLRSEAAYTVRGANRWRQVTLPSDIAASLLRLLKSCRGYCASLCCALWLKLFGRVLIDQSAPPEGLPNSSHFDGASVIALVEKTLQLECKTQITSDP